MIKWISPNHLLAWFEDHNKTDGYILGRNNMASTAWSDTKPNKITSRFSNAYRLLDLEWWWVFAFLFHLYLNFFPPLLFIHIIPISLWSICYYMSCTTFLWVTSKLFGTGHYPLLSTFLFFLVILKKCNQRMKRPDLSDSIVYHLKRLSGLFFFFFF